MTQTSRIRGVVQIVKKDGGENNLHYHTNSDSLWMVLKGRIRFYGPNDEVIGEFGPQEGTITPEQPPGTRLRLGSNAATSSGVAGGPPPNTRQSCVELSAATWCA